MRGFLLSVSALTMISTSALAADVDPVSTFDWTGAYAGLFTSYSSFDGEASLGGVSDDVELDGFGGGALLGYNIQADSFVFGLEADIGTLNIDGDSLLPAPHEQELGLAYNARVRLGYALDNTLLFVQGGIAAVEFDADLAGGGANIASETLLGYQLGAGIEHAFSDNWSLRGDYLYTNYEDVTGNPPVTFDPDGHSVRVGLNYLF